MKGIVLAAGIGVGVISLGAAATIGSQTDYLKAKADAYTLVLNKDNKPAELTSSYQDNFSGTVQTALGNDVTLNLVKAKTASNGFAELASRGQIYNFGATSGAVTGLTSVKITLSSGSATIRTAASSEISNNGVTLGKTISLTSGSSVTVPASNYFMVEAGDTGAVISSLELSYNCAATDDVKRLNGTYTGNMTSDGYNYKLTLNDGSATLASINKDSNTSVNGAATLSGSTLTATFSGTTYTLTVSADAYSLTSSQITFYRVYDVEDFESYSTDGQGWASNRGESSQYDGTGVKGNYYCDYYGDNNIASPIGGSGWSMMGSTNYMLFSSTAGYNGSKVAAFKGNGSQLRYFQQKAYYGIPEVIGKGTTLSFFAKGAVNSTFGESTSDTTFKVFAYYNSKVTSSNQSTRTEKEFTIPAESGWREYTMPLDSSKNYYAFAIYTKNSTSTERWTLIDNIKIYTVKPYSPIRVTGVTLSEDSRHMSVGEEHQLHATVAPANADNNLVSWSSSNTSVATVDSTGKVTAVGSGSANITVTTADGSKTATCAITVTQLYPSGTYFYYGSIGSGSELIIIAVCSNGDVTMKIDVDYWYGTVSSYNTSSHKLVAHIEGTHGTNRATIGYLQCTYNSGTLPYLSSAQFYSSATGTSKSTFGSNVNGGSTFTMNNKFFNDCDGTTSQLQSTFSRRYGDPWNTDTSNADRIVSYTDESIGGQKSLKVRGWNGGRVGLTLASDFSSPIAAKQLSFWVYNTSNSTETLQVFVYKATGHNSAQGIGNVITARANNWTFYSIGFNANVYNFQFTVTSSIGASLLFDNIAVW